MAAQTMDTYCSSNVMVVVMGYKKSLAEGQLSNDHRLWRRHQQSSYYLPLHSVGKCIVRYCVQRVHVVPLHEMCALKRNSKKKNQRLPSRRLTTHPPPPALLLINKRATSQVLRVRIFLHVQQEIS